MTQWSEMLHCVTIRVWILWFLLPGIWFCEVTMTFDYKFLVKMLKYTNWVQWPGHKLIHFTAQSWPVQPLFGLCVSRYSSSPWAPGLITTQVRVRSTRGGFFAGFLGKFWTPSSSSQGSDGHNRQDPLVTEGEEESQKWCNIMTTWRCEGRALTTVLYIRQGGGFLLQLW